MSLAPLQSRRIRTEAERQAVIAAALADNDAMTFPSHLLRREGEIVGAFSAAVVPLLLVWNRTDKITARDSTQLPALYDAVMEERGFGRYFIACNERSPYRPHMARLGFSPYWQTQLFEGGANLHE